MRSMLCREYDRIEFLKNNIFFIENLPTKNHLTLI